jgi:hypothetical protein
LAQSVKLENPICVIYSDHRSEHQEHASLTIWGAAGQVNSNVIVLNVIVVWSIPDRESFRGTTRKSILLAHSRLGELKR